MQLYITGIRQTQGRNKEAYTKYKQFRMTTNGARNHTGLWVPAFTKQSIY